MSDYNGCFICLAQSPTYYAVDDGKKTLVESLRHMNQLGHRPLIEVTVEELKAIPFAVGGDEEE
jgi:ferredoxin